MRLMLTACLLFLAAPAFAQEKPLAKVYACSDIKDGAQRLACFDAAVAGLKADEAKGDVAVVSRGQIREAEVKSFGLPNASVTSSVAAAAGKPAKPEETPDKVKMAVKSISAASDGKIFFSMENGQVWRQTDGDHVDLGNPPWIAEVRKGALGSFMLSVNGKHAVRVKRQD